MTRYSTEISYYRDKVNDDANENNDDGYRVNNERTTASRSFEYKTKKRPHTRWHNKLNAQFVAPLKCLNNLCRSLDLTLINWKIKLDSKWSRNCVRSEILRTTKIDANPAVNSPVLATTAITTTSAIFQITNPKLYKINDNMKFWENIKQGFKRIMSWNRYRSEILTKTKKSTT